MTGILSLHLAAKVEDLGSPEKAICTAIKWIKEKKKWLRARVRVGDSKMKNKNAKWDKTR
jgi:hypothetical protein